MARSQSKLPYVNARLVEKIRKAIDEAKKSAAIRGGAMPPVVVKTYSRNSTIIDLMIGVDMQVYNGKKFISVKVQDSFLGHKLGEFSPTRTFTGHPLLKKQKAEGKKEKK